MNRIFVILSLMAVLFYSCSEESILPVPVDLQSEYYPLEKGKTWIYSTDSIVYNLQLGSVDTLRGFVKETIRESFETSAGSTTFVIERSFRRSLEDDWSLTDVFSASYIDNKATRTEENLRFVKLLLPPVENQEWDGNQFIDESIIVNINGENIQVYKNWNSEVVAINDNFTVGMLDYTDVVEVQLADSENSIEKRYAKEIYARDVGLIYREMVIIDTQNTNLDLPIEERAEKGFVLTQTLIQSF